MLQCLILGVPEPQVEWTLDGQLIPGSPTRQILSNGSLYFNVVNRTFAGQYACRGSNSVGSVESSPVLFSVACKCIFPFNFVIYCIHKQCIHSFLRLSSIHPSIDPFIYISVCPSCQTVTYCSFTYSLVNPFINFQYVLTRL